VTDVLDAPAATPTAPHAPTRPVHDDDAAPGPAPAPAPGRRVSPLWRPAGYYLATRVVVYLTAAVTAAFNRQLHVVSTFGSIWDGRWYIRIAQHGYPHQLVSEGVGNRWAFFPAFPALVRGVAVVTRLPLADAAAATAFVLGLTATLAIWLALREVVGTTLADRATLLFVCCPTAYVLSLGYTEGLFLTAAALSLFALSRRMWVTAGLCACVAGLTRNTGIAVIAAVILTTLAAAWRGRALRPLAGAALAPLGLAGFMAYGWFMVGTPVAFLSSERFWQGQHFVWFVTPLEAIVGALHQGPGGVTFMPDAMAGTALVLGLLGIWLLDRMRRAPDLLPATGPVAAGSSIIPLSWWVYTVGALLVAYSAYFTDSIPRYTMAAFQLFAAIAWKLPARIVGVVAALLVCMQAALLVAVLTIALHPMAVPLVP
jgi:hypothetical protein